VVKVDLWLGKGPDLFYNRLSSDGMVKGAWPLELFRIVLRSLAFEASLSVLYFFVPRELLAFMERQRRARRDSSLFVRAQHLPSMRASHLPCFAFAAFVDTMPVVPV
jgi:hypothetical protein